MGVPGCRHLKNIHPYPFQMSFSHSPMLETVLTIHTSPNFIISVGFISDELLKET